MSNQVVQTVATERSTGVNAGAVTKQRIHPVLWLLPISTLFVVHAWLYRGFFIDDALISFRYVRQFVAGNGLVYNVGERVEGYSNFLWIMLLAPFSYLQFDLVAVSKALGLGLSLLTLLATWRLARRLPFPWVAPLLLAVAAPFAAWTMGGLETPLFALLLITSSLLFIEEEEGGNGWRSGVVFGLLALTRPEALVFAVVAIGMRLGRLYRMRTKPHMHDWLRLLGLGVVFLPFFVWRLLYYGYPLPNTVYAKSMGLNPRALFEGGYYVYQSIAASGGFLVVALPLLLWVQPKRPLWVSYLTANLGAYLLFMVLGGGDWMPMQRFAVHILPIVMVLAHAGLVQLSTLWPVSKARALVVGLLVLGQAGYLLVGSFEQRFIQGVGRGAVGAQELPVVRYVRERVQAGDTIAVDIAGALAYYLPLEVRVVDVNGLADGHIAHLPAQFPGGLFGRGDGFGKWDVDYVLAQEPRFVQVAWQEMGADGQYRTANTGQTLLINDPRFRASYDMLNEPGLVGLFVRKE